MYKTNSNCIYNNSCIILELKYKRNMYKRIYMFEQWEYSRRNNLFIAFVGNYSPINFSSFFSPHLSTRFRSLKSIHSSNLRLLLSYKLRRTSGTLLQFMAAFCPLESRDPPLKRSPPDTFKSRTLDVTRKLQPVVARLQPSLG